MPINRDATTPPPRIGKLGPYTVFITPPSTPTPEPGSDLPPKVAPLTRAPAPRQVINGSVYAQPIANGSVFGSPETCSSSIVVSSNGFIVGSPKKAASLPPVQSPPPQFAKDAYSEPVPNGFFRNVVIKLQNAHSSLDSHLASWFGLDQSKYQWALDDYHERKGLKNGAMEKKLSDNIDRP